jgi:hypothetical protein
MRRAITVRYRTFGVRHVRRFRHFEGAEAA